MTVLEASSVRCKTMADGTLQITVSVDPPDAVRAFTLFGAPGQPMALAALKPATSKPAEREQLGALCWWLVQRCKEPIFWKWLESSSLTSVMNESDAVLQIYQICNITSRRELDTNEEAAAIFKAKVMQPYSAHLKRQGISS